MAGCRQKSLMFLSVHISEHMFFFYLLLCFGVFFVWHKFFHGFSVFLFLLPEAEVSLVSQGGGRIPHRPPESCPGSVDLELGNSSLGLGLTSLWGPAARRVLRGGSVASDSSWHPVGLGHTPCFSGGTAEGPPSHLCCHLHACGVSVCGLDFFA